MNKTKFFKALGLAMCAILLVVGSVAGTFAYLKDEATVTNTFTAGNVEITLDEAAVNEYGVYETDANNRTLDNDYKLIPGHTYIKDPTIHVAAGSEACFLFVKVENGISAIEADGNTIADQLEANGWIELEDDSNIYFKNEIVDASNKTEDIDVVIFTSFTVKSDADVSGYVTDDNADAVINVTAYAIQADGVNEEDGPIEQAAQAWANGNFS